MEENILHIEPVNRPGAGQSQRENHPDGGWLDNWTECFIIINSRTLCEAPKNPAGFIAIKRAICLKFMTKNPLVGDEIDAGQARHESPGVIGE
jgi:hypothetical protein